MAGGSDNDVDNDDGAAAAAAAAAAADDDDDDDDDDDEQKKARNENFHDLVYCYCMPSFRPSPSCQEAPQCLHVHNLSPATQQSDPHQKCVRDAQGS